MLSNRTSHTDITDVAQRSSRRPLSAALCGWSDPWPKLRWLAHAHKAPPQPPHRGVLLVDTTTCLLFIKKVVSEETKGEFPGKVVARPFIDSGLSHTFDLTGQGRPVLQLPDKTTYLEGKVPLKKAKLNDIIKLRPYIPIELEEWYSEIYIWPTTEEEHEDFDD
ncbi:hypothetical protein J6590_097399 [Homalodisca vitripennis]|nr:hypothetical protein J6590_097399 [Homalodisca vitripennis]